MLPREAATPGREEPRTFGGGSFPSEGGPASPSARRGAWAAALWTGRRGERGWDRLALRSPPGTGPSAGGGDPPGLAVGIPSRNIKCLRSVKRSVTLPSE